MGEAPKDAAIVSEFSFHATPAYSPAVLRVRDVLLSSGLQAIACLMLATCTFSKFEPQRCASNLQCREQFGFAHECRADGYCQPVAIAPRCTKTYPEDLFQRRSAFKQEIVLGAILQLDGETKTDSLAAATFALVREQVLEEERRRRPEAEYGLVICETQVDRNFDNQGVEEAAIDTMLYLTGRLGVPVVLGPRSSRQVEKVYDTATLNEALIIAYAATSPQLTALGNGGSRLMIRTIASDRIQASAAVADILDRGVRSLSVVHESGAYGDGFADEVRRAADDRLHVDAFQFTAGSVNERNDAIQNAANTSNEELLLVTSNERECDALLRGIAATAAIGNRRMFFTDGCANDGLVDAVETLPSLRDRIRGSRPASPSGTDYDAFRSAYAALDIANKPEVTSSPFGPYSYDAAWLGFLGATAARNVQGGVKGSSVLNVMRRISAGTRLSLRTSNWANLVEPLEQGGAVDVIGASGELNYDPATMETSSATEIWVLDEDFVITPVR